MEDPIVEEFRMIRQAHAEKFDNDPAKICDDFRQQQKKYADRLVVRMPKTVKKKAV